MSYIENMHPKEPSTCLSRHCSWFAEHRDLQATAMSVDWSGQWVLLAGRRHLALQSLDQDDDGSEDSLHKFHRNSKYEVSAAEWAICQNSQEYCAIATSQLIEVVTWRSGDPTLIHSLRAHTRVITDIDWHSQVPHLLASCSVDTFTHLWDLRDPRKPIMSLSAVCMSGATQVGFNRVSGNLLATAHDGDLRIWDQRKGSCPIQYITAHLARVHGINWSHQHETQLTTASQDGTVKYFDINNPKRADRIITTSSPVWRARYTPFADGLVTVIVPHLGRGENSVLLWNNSKQSAPICSFIGHTDVVLDFAWRPNRLSNNNADMDLITWSRDQTVRIWKVDENLQKLCETPESDDDGIILEENFNKLNVEIGGDAVDGSGGGGGGAAGGVVGGDVGSSSGGVAIARIPKPRLQSTCSLQHEFSLLNTNIPHIDVELLDPNKRHAMVRLSVNGRVIMLQITFPVDYPSPGCQPEFIYCQGTSIDDDLSEQMIKVLKVTAYHRVRKSRTCLEQCLRSLVTAMRKATSGGDKSYLRLQSPRLEGALCGALHGACVPFPKTSGARFNQVNILVTFSQPNCTKGFSLKHSNTTPRSLSALSCGYLGNVIGSQSVLYSHKDAGTAAIYLHERVRKSSRNRGILPRFTAPSVTIYDASKILFVNKELAENYMIDAKHPIEMCQHNRNVAQQFGFADLTQCWSLAETIASAYGALESEDDAFVQQQQQQIPFPKITLESLILHYAQNFDIQTAAMLCCAFGRYCTPHQSSRSSSMSRKSATHSHLLSGQRIVKPSGSPYHTILPVDSKTNQSWNLATQIKQLRSNSWSDSVDDIRLADLELNRSILGDSHRQLYDSFKRAYAEMLYRWQLLVPRAKLLKHLSFSSDTFRGVEFVTECLVCAKETVGAVVCRDCHKPLLRCTLCRLPVRGAANACLQCGHGGHTEHMRQWFERNEMCAYGCGCLCLIESGKMVDL